MVTQYVSPLSFGSVVAVLTATMGDAAFLLIAQEPMTGLMMIAVGFLLVRLAVGCELHPWPRFLTRIN